MRKIVLGVMFSVGLGSAPLVQAKITAMDLVGKPNGKVLQNCKLTGSQLIKGDESYQLRVSSVLQNFGALNVSDFDGSDCLTIDSITSESIITTKLFQTNKRFIGQKIQAYIAYAPASYKTFAVVIDESLSNYIYGHNEKELLDAISTYIGKEGVPNKFKADSQFKFKDFGVSNEDRAKEAERVNAERVKEAAMAQAIKDRGLGYSVSYDKFEKIYKIASEEKDQNIIRASLDAPTKKIRFVQLYTSVGFGDSWGNIQSAVDIDSNRYSVVRIDTDTKCFGGGIRCYNTEVIGVNISMSLLEKNRDGFELKLIGRHEAVIKVSRESIDAFFKALKEVKGQKI